MQLRHRKGSAAASGRIYPDGRAGRGIDLSSSQTDTGSNYRRFELAVFLRPTRGICSRSSQGTAQPAFSELPAIDIPAPLDDLVSPSSRSSYRASLGQETGCRVRRGEWFLSTTVTMILIGRCCVTFRERLGNN